MKIITIFLSLCLIGCKEEKDTTFKEIPLNPQPNIDSSCIFQNTFTNLPTNNVQVLANPDRPDYPAISTIDNNLNTFMTTHPLLLGQEVTIVYNLNGSYNVHSLELIDAYNSEYKMGDLTIYTSSDQNTWTKTAELNYLTSGTFGGRTFVNVKQCSIQYIRLSMRYMGSGASGNTPSFYLSEILFNIK